MRCRSHALASLVDGLARRDRRASYLLSRSRTVEFVRPTASPRPLERFDIIGRSATPPAAMSTASSKPDRVEGTHAETVGSAVARGARSLYDFMLGDDIAKAFGATSSSQQRELGTFSLASNLVPSGKVAALAIKALGHIGIDLASHAAASAVRSAGEVAAAGTSDGVFVDVASRALVSQLRDVGARFPSLDLRAIEDGGKGVAHTLAKHVGKTDAELRERLTRESVSASSTYTDLASAQLSTDFIIGRAQNQAKIDRWLREGAKGTQVLDATIPGDPVGRTISRIDAAAGRGATATSDARVVLKADPHSAAGYTVLTSYPTKPV